MDSKGFPSGEWVGFYTYSGRARKHRMDLILDFSNGRISGEGMDDVGGFVITGTYNSTSMECSWSKDYIGRHTVFYEGYGENKGIWGTWEIYIDTGGFHIWPVSGGSGADASETEEEPVEDVELEPVLVH